MRVALVSYHGCPLAAPGTPSTGGMQVYVREISRALAAQGHQVDVFTRRTSADVSQVVEDRSGVRVVHIDAGPAAPVPKSDLLSYLGEFARGVERFRQDSRVDYDVIHSHYWLSGEIGRMLVPLWDVPHVTMFHTLGEIKNRARMGERESEARLLAERKIMAEADRIVVASPHERNQLLRFYGVDAGRIRIVPCGVDLTRFRPYDKALAKASFGIETTFAVAFVGRLEPLKGVDILLRAVGGLANRDDITVLLIGGSSDGHPREPERLADIAAEVGIARNVRFLGARSQDELPLLYSAADVTAVPSYYESFGLAAVESLACGTPVVASRVGGLTSTIRDGETGYLIPWRCPEAFEERLELLFGNAALRDLFGRSARPSVERFGWPNIATQIGGVYGELADLARPRLALAR